MTAHETNERLFNILRQEPRLAREARDQTRNVNEAYLMVHGAMARALDRDALHAPADAFDPPALRIAT